MEEYRDEIRTLIEAGIKAGGKGARVSATIKPAKTPGYFDLVALSMLPEEEE